MRPSSEKLAAACHCSTMLALSRVCLLQPRTFLELGSRLVALPDLPEVTKNVWSKKL